MHACLLLNKDSIISQYMTILRRNLATEVLSNLMICMFSFLCTNFKEKNKSIQMQELCSRETFKVFDGLEILCRVFKLIYASKKIY